MLTWGTCCGIKPSTETDDSKKSKRNLKCTSSSFAYWQSKGNW
jgi:hypothetical protein